jgi:hypothetical protein
MNNDTPALAFTRRQFVTTLALTSASLALCLGSTASAQVLPSPPVGYALLVDDAGDLVTDEAGNYLIGKEAL